MFFESPNSDLISKTLDGLHVRHQAILSNVANGDTPGYKRQVVDFEKQLQRFAKNQQSKNKIQDGTDPTELKMTNPFHLDKHGALGGQGQNASAERVQFDYRLDQNGVDVEAEMVELTKNSERFTALTRLQFRQFDEIKTILRNEK